MIPTDGRLSQPQESSAFVGHRPLIYPIAMFLSSNLNRKAAIASRLMGSCGLNDPSGNPVVMPTCFIHSIALQNWYVLDTSVNGPVTANDFLELQSKAKIVGDIEYRTLEMHLGAVIQGRLNHVEPGTASASVVELKRVSAE